MGRFPVYGMKVVRYSEECPPKEGSSYILLEDTFVPTETLVYGPVPDLHMDMMWFTVVHMRRLLAEDTHY
ncbi:hypothetical protein 043JT007_264 [Bacillus phage 043JT007]|nr:hypothetical protein 043JT007_264 [Bacillus phage 043JT007]